MATRDVSQLLLQVDANVAVAQRNLQQLSRVVASESASMDQSLGRVESAHARLSLAGNQSRIAMMELQHVARGSADQFAAGAAPTQIFAQHISMIAEAASFAGAGMGKFGAFLAGPWGLAVTTGVAVLASLIAKHHSTGDAVDELVDKMRKQARQSALNEEADRAWQNTLEGVEDALRKNQKALDELSKAQKSSAEKDLASALSAKGRLDGIISETEANISLARSLYEVQKARASGPGQRGEIATLGLEGKLGNLDALESTLAKAKADSVNVAKQIEDATSQVLKTAATETDAELIQHKYDALIEKARQRAVAEHKVGDELIRQITQLEKQKDAEIKAAEARAKKPSTSDVFGFGRQIDFSRAEDIARAAGLQVNSGYRSAAQQAALYNNPNVNRPGNPVAAPGASAHNGANGKWAIDVQITDGLTPGKIRQIYAEQGVSLTKVLKEKGHFHIEGSRSEAAAAENAARTAQVRQIKGEGAFTQAGDRLDQELLQARLQLVGDYRQQADIARQQLDAENKKLVDGISEQEELGKATGYQQGITAAQGEILRAKAAELNRTREAAVSLAEYERFLKETQQTADQSYQLQIEDLRGIDDRVRTQDEHRHVQLEILDLVYEQKRMDLEYLQAQALRNGQLEEANRLQQQINHLPTEKASDADRVRRGTMGPLEAMADSVPKTAKEINEAFQSIEAQGLDGLSQAIAGVITGTENLKDAFGNLAKSIIADIIQMTVKMLIFRAISGLFGGGSSFGSASLINTASPLSGALSSAVPIAAGAGFRAAGGPVTAGQAYIVGERRPELFVPSTNGVIVPNVPRISIPSAANDRAPTTIVHQTFAPNFAGNSATREEVQQMGLMAKMGAIQAIRETQRRR
jgi:hypothetical protein